MSRIESCDLRATFFITSSVSPCFLEIYFPFEYRLELVNRISLYCSLFTNYSCSTTKCEMGNEGDLYIGSYY
jgi:hypothetical protein